MAYRKLGRITHRALQLAATFKDDPGIVDVPGRLATARRVLVCASRRSEVAPAAVEFVQRLTEILPRATVLLVADAELAGAEEALERTDLVVVSSEDINWLGLPKKPVLLQLFVEDYDLAIDLSVEFDLVNAHLCRRSRAALRACLHHPQRDPFFNLQVRTPASMATEEKYHAVLRCLRTLLPHPQTGPVAEAMST